MLPDPWIVVAEIINFLILVALLQRFLYKPITQAMTQREASIADRLQSATLREVEAQQTIEQYEQLQVDWAETTKARFHAMHQQLETEQIDRREQMRAALATKRKQWYEALHQEQQACLANLRDQVQAQLIQTVRRTLNDLANTTLEQQMLEVLLHQLQTLDPADQQLLQEAVNRQGGHPHWQIITTFALEPAVRNRLISAVQSQLVPQIQPDAFSFETHPDRPCGIELRTQGYKLAWHIEHYLDRLENQLNHDLANITVR